MATIGIFHDDGSDQTAAIARYAAGVVAGRGHRPILADLSKRPPRLAPRSRGIYDAVIVGSSVRQGQATPAVVDWVRANRPLLTAMPGAFYLVAPASVAGHPEAQRRSISLLRRFGELTDWRPNTVAAFAGTLAFACYDCAGKRVTRMVARRPVFPLEEPVRREADLTDWEEVRALAESVGDALTQARSATA